MLGTPHLSVTTLTVPPSRRALRKGNGLNGISYRQLALPEVLKEIGRHLLTEFCGRFQSDLAAKNISLPPADAPADEYFKSLARLLKSPALLPDSFKETLFDIEELARPEHSHFLREAVAQVGQPLITIEGVCHERVAVQLWLANPALLAGVHNQPGDLACFEGFAPAIDRPGRAPPTVPTPATVEQLSARIDLWFRQNHSRGQTAKIELYVNPPREYWFVIRHGDTCRWAYNDEKGTAQLVHSGPEDEEASVYLTEQDELWITARTKVERDLFRRQFGLYLRSDADYFSQPCAFTLEPLKIEGTDALNLVGSQEICSMKLHQVEFDRGGGTHKTTVETLDQEFGAARTTRSPTCFVANTDILIRAGFLIQLHSSQRTRTFEICPPYALELERPSDLAPVIRLLSQRGFRILQTQLPHAHSKAA